MEEALSKANKKSGQLTIQNQPFPLPTCHIILLNHKNICESKGCTLKVLKVTCYDKR